MVDCDDRPGCPDNPGNVKHAASWWRPVTYTRQRDVVDNGSAVIRRVSNPNSRA